MNKLRRASASLRGISLCALSSLLFSACIPPLLTTDANLGPNDATAQVRFRFIGNGSLNVVQHGRAACYGEGDAAVRSLAFITHREHSLDVLSVLNAQPRLNMPNDLDGVSKSTYAEVVVKAGTPLVFSAHWRDGEGFQSRLSWSVMSFTPAAGANYEVVVTDDFETPMQVRIAQLKVDDAKVERVPVDARPLRICGAG